jgi:hypothetical protein
MSYVCLTNKVLIKGLVWQRDHTSSRLLFEASEAKQAKASSFAFTRCCPKLLLVPALTTWPNKIVPTQNRPRWLIGAVNAHDATLFAAAGSGKC